MKVIKWKDIQVGDVLPDGSVVEHIHQSRPTDCIRIKYSIGRDVNTLDVSTGHLFLCKVPRRYWKSYRERIRDYYIPKEVSGYIEQDKTFTVEEYNKILECCRTNEEQPDWVKIEYRCDNWESVLFSESQKLAWMPAEDIYRFINTYGVKSIKTQDKRVKIIDAEYIGEKEAFCISTNTGRYITLSGNNCEVSGTPAEDKIQNAVQYKVLIRDNDVVVEEERRPIRVLEKVSGLCSHNSVAVRNIIFHCLTHGVAIGLVDLKRTEFTFYKGHNFCLGVANTVEEAAELLRIAREVMYKRNKEMAKVGCVKLSEMKYTQETDYVEIFGRRYHKSEQVEIKDGEETRTITVGELINML